MKKYQRPLIALTAAVVLASSLSACVVVPARGYYKYKYRYYGQATPTQVAPQAAATANA
jgi:hypothetical protein